MLTVTSKREFPYDKDGELCWQMDMEDSSDNPEGVVMVEMGHKIIFLFFFF